MVLSLYGLNRFGALACLLVIVAGQNLLCTSWYVVDSIQASASPAGARYMLSIQCLVSSGPP